MPLMEGTRALGNLARSAAHVRDAKPEGDVHSIHSNPFNLTSFIPSHFHAVRNEARGGFRANPVPKPSASKQPVLSGGSAANPVPKPGFGLTCVPRCPDWFREVLSQTLRLGPDQSDQYDDTLLVQLGGGFTSKPLSRPHQV